MAPLGSEGGRDDGATWQLARVVVARTGGRGEADSQRGESRLALDYHQDEAGEVEKLQTWGIERRWPESGGFCRRRQGGRGSNSRRGGSNPMVVREWREVWMD